MSDTTTLLWTGGWDSTFRLLQLLLIEKRNVQPVYVIDITRFSAIQELKTMDVISRMVRERMEPGVVLYPTIVFLQSDFSDNPGIRDRYTSLKKRFHVARQYHWLALIAESQNWSSVELCFERYPEEPPELYKTIFDGIETNHPTLKDSWDAELFKYWSFPLITLTKSQMRKIAKDHGFIDILQKRWFCLRPIRGKCCGACKPCKIAISAGATDEVTFVHPVETAARTMLRKIRR